MDRGAWQATVHGGAKRWTQLSNYTFTLRNAYLTRKRKQLTYAQMNATCCSKYLEG